MIGWAFQSKNYMKREKGDRRRGGGEEEQISKTMSWVLRHGAVEEGLTIDTSGYVPLVELIPFLRKKGCRNIDEERIRAIVANNDKKRYELEERKHHVFIRATQGHSIKSVNTEDLLTKITDPALFPVVVHGTFTKFWASIRAGGLKRMSRNHIHFAPGLPKEEGVVSGMRGSCDIIIVIDMAAAMRDGIEFYVSSNNVILTEGEEGVLSPKYFKRVVRRDGTLIEGRLDEPEEKEKEKEEKEVEVKPELPRAESNQQGDPKIQE